MFARLGAAAARFYTSEVALHEPDQRRSPMGDRYTVPGESLGNLSCNIQPTTCEAAQRQYGVEIVEGWRLSCAPDARVQPGKYVLWQGRPYRVKAALHHPSHTDALITREDVPDED